MKTVNKLILTFLSVFFLCSIVGAQINNTVTEKVIVYGNCEMCKTTIQNAGNNKNVSEVVWDKDTKVAVITYDKTKTTLDKILKKIARSGYDNQKFKANELAYESLPACCQYERKK